MYFSVSLSAIYPGDIKRYLEIFCFLKLLLLEFFRARCYVFFLDDLFEDCFKLICLCGELLTLLLLLEWPRDDLEWPRDDLDLDVSPTVDLDDLWDLRFEGPEA